MKHLTKENVVLVLVGLLALVQVREIWGESKAPERSRGAIMERMRGMDRGDWKSRAEAWRGLKRDSKSRTERMKKARKGKAEDASFQTGSFEFFLGDPAPLPLSPGVTCCDQKLPCCDSKKS
jgi:hypothetical protein